MIFKEYDIQYTPCSEQAALQGMGKYRRRDSISWYILFGEYEENIKVVRFPNPLAIGSNSKWVGEPD